MTARFSRSRVLLALYVLASVATLLYTVGAPHLSGG